MKSFAPVAATSGVVDTVIDPGPVASDSVTNVRDDLGELLTDTDSPNSEMFSDYVGTAKTAAPSYFMPVSER